MITHTTRRALIGGAGLFAVAGGIAITSQAKGATLPAVDRTAWDQAFKAMTEANRAYDAAEVWYDRADTAGTATDAMYAEYERYGEAQYETTWTLFAIPAPDRMALLWKTEYLFGDHMGANGSSPSWAAHVMEWYMADQRRLLGQEAR
ncbi:hypothetical protein [Sphingomonas sp. OK281]|uniref:hypothetical protein n=1 Tax=Sphingomonas sp. OK281 TaxID=1881067 RepID=UPI0008F27358|nr:hypothetical protein [Sphingomonas sp. OK281]SFO02053.1 hypothetical protein SAMN05428984_1663 [Sphingomonas sp. OK281]